MEDWMKMEIDLVRFLFSSSAIGLEPRKKLFWFTEFTLRLPQSQNVNFHFYFFIFNSMHNSIEISWKFGSLAVVLRTSGTGKFEPFSS